MENSLKPGDIITHRAWFTWGLGTIIAVESDLDESEEDYSSVWALWSDGHVHISAASLLRKTQ